MCVLQYLFVYWMEGRRGILRYCLSFPFDIYSYDEIWSLKCTTKNNQKVKLNKSGVIKKILSLCFITYFYNILFSFKIAAVGLPNCDNIILTCCVLLNFDSLTLPPRAMRIIKFSTTIYRNNYWFCWDDDFIIKCLASLYK